MTLSKIIDDSIPPLKTSDTGLKALNWMDEFRVSHLPIVNHQDFLGLISEADVLDLNTPEEALGAHSLSLIRPFVYEHQHVFEALKLIKTLDLTLVPVLNTDGHYVGNITLPILVHSMAELFSVQNPGGIIVLELHEQDYSLSEIAQIVESNDAKILSLSITGGENQMIELTIKINREDLRRVLQTFHRYNYQIKATHHQGEFDDDLRQRFDMFMHYINI